MNYRKPKIDNSGRSIDNGLQADSFEKALESARKMTSDPNFDKFATAEAYKKSLGNGDEEGENWPRQPGSSDHGDPFSHIVKPKNVKFWDHVPTDEEEPIYYGLHIHSENNPLGLHSHIPGGKPSGGHTHGPQNRFGVHHHRDVDPETITNTTSFQIDGKHTHEYGKNMPSGKHEHCPENFG